MGGCQVRWWVGGVNWGLVRGWGSTRLAYTAKLGGQTRDKLMKFLLNVARGKSLAQRRVARLMGARETECRSDCQSGPFPSLRGPAARRKCGDEGVVALV